jgi:signal transduction histidine kinase
MSRSPDSPAAAFEPIDSLNVFASLLGEVETATPAGAFYNRLAEAVCRLGSMRSAVVFVYDDVARRVRVVGAHNIDIALSDAERDVLWSLGKVCALALSARLATRTQVDARHLADRIDLAREIHERVVQRVFGVVMALQSGVLLAPEDQQRASDELRGALDDLREAMRRPLAATPKLVTFTLHEELQRLAEADVDGINVDWQPDVEIPAQFDAVCVSVFSEAIRNARRHASPTRIDVVVSGDTDTVSLEITNDGVGPSQLGGAGMGLRIAAFEALQHGASLNFGPRGPDHWHVRLVLPRPESA